MDAGAVVRELLSRSGLTKSALSAGSGVSRSSIDEYLKGERQPSLAQLERLGEAAGFTVEIQWGTAGLAASDQSSTPRWARPNPKMDAQPLTVHERAKVLEQVVATAVIQQRRPRGELKAVPFRRLRKAS